MHEISMYVVLFLFLSSQYIAGRFITQFLIGGKSSPFTFVAAFLTGVTVSVPVTYLLSLLFVPTGQSLLLGTLGSIVFVFVWLTMRLFRRNTKKNTPDIHADYSQILLVIFSLVFGWWIMTKTFHSGSSGEVFVGSNNVFDFGHAIGIVRSFSWGNNIPFMSPFQAGLPFFYHFFFLYWVGIWEYFGVPIVWAFNIPSALSFAALLVMVYYLPQRILGQGKLAGWVSVILTITNSTLTFWHLLIQKGLHSGFFRYIWQLPTYPYAGPFDGSMISIFTTLNNYVNQRHLAFGIATGLILYMTIVEMNEEKHIHTSKVAVLGGLTGLLFLWNMAICLSVGVVIALFLGLKKNWKYVLVFISVAAVAVTMSLIPYLPKWKDILWLLNILPHSIRDAAGKTGQTSNAFAYLWENLGLLPVAVILGLAVMPQKRRVLIIPLLTLFVLECVYATVNGTGFDQKFFSFFIIGANIAAGAGILWLWQHKGIAARIAAIAVFCVLTASGFVDLMAIKNEFAYPLIDLQTAPVITWIHDKTPKGSVFVSYSDIIDPVVLAGRKNYFGFFRNIGALDRTKTVSAVYAGDAGIARANGFSYILIPKLPKNDFRYDVNPEKLHEAGTTTVFESERYLILGVDPGMLK